MRYVDQPAHLDRALWELAAAQPSGATEAHVDELVDAAMSGATGGTDFERDCREVTLRAAHAAACQRDGIRAIHARRHGRRSERETRGQYAERIRRESLSEALDRWPGCCEATLLARLERERRGWTLTRESATSDQPLADRWHVPPVAPEAVIYHDLLAGSRPLHGVGRVGRDGSGYSVPNVTPGTDAGKRAILREERLGDFDPAGMGVEDWSHWRVATERQIKAARSQGIERKARRLEAQLVSARKARDAARQRKAAQSRAARGIEVDRAEVEQSLRTAAKMKPRPSDPRYALLTS